MSALLPFIRLTALLRVDNVSGRCDASEQQAGFTADYAHRAGFRVGSEGDWFAEDRVGTTPKTAAESKTKPLGIIVR